MPERLKRIQTGQQFEHADVVGHHTQKKFNKIFARRSKRKKRSFADNLMVVIAFFSGMAAVLLGRLIYFKMAQMEGLPDAFYDLGPRGMGALRLRSGGHPDGDVPPLHAAAFSRR